MTTQEEKLEKAKQKLAKAQKQIALINDKRKKADTKAKVLLGVICTIICSKDEKSTDYFIRHHCCPAKHPILIG